MAYEALRHYSDRGLTFRFVSNVDGTDFVEATQRSRSGRDALHHRLEDVHDTGNDDQRRDGASRGCSRSWRRRKRLRNTSSPFRRMPAKVSEFGIDTANMFGFWDWVGGRYSMDSAIGLSTMLAIGPENFRAMLDGFHEMDEHFRTRPSRETCPCCWACCPFGTPTSSEPRPVASCLTNNYLKRFPRYLQQLTMESNGKHVTSTGESVNYHTGPIYWGEPGTNGQHPFTN